jgi:hypothetical protein
MVNKRIKFPPQHGAWVFLIIPSVMTSFLGAGNLLGLIFSITWVGAYPFSYFFGRALVARLRRGSWTNRATMELRFGLPWGVLTTIGGTTLIAVRPWVLVPGLLLVALWSISVYLAWSGRERGITNDLLLVLLASVAPILMYQVVKNESSVRDLPHSIWIASYVCLLFFVGSVLHVKALIREAKNPMWHLVSIGFHVAALVLLALTTHSWWLTIPFVGALARTVVMKPGLRPGKIGVVELVVALLVVICTVIVEI